MSNSYNVLIQRLKRFIKSYYTNILIRGLFSVVTILLLLFIVFCAIEYFSFLSGSFRKILFWAYMSVAIILCIKFIFIPLIQLLQLTKKRLSNKEAAKIIGLHFPEIEDKLINILELRTLKENFGAELIVASIEKKYKKIAPFKFKAAIDWRTTLKYLKISLIPFAILFILFFTGYSEIISSGTSRIVQYNNSFEPPPPFKFIVTSELQTLEKKDFVLTIKTEGTKIPENVFIRYNENSYQTKKIQANSFEYTFKSPKKNIYFELFYGDIQSELILLKILPAPILTNMEVVITPPSYTKIKPIQIKDLGFLQVPEGSLVSWHFNSKNTNQISFCVNNESDFLNVKNNSSQIQKVLKKSTEYSISVANEFKEFEDSIKYFIDVVKDEFPTISAEEVIDSADVSKRFIKGVINDDYGFSSLDY